MLLIQGAQRFVVAVGVLLFAPLAHADHIANPPADHTGLDQPDRQSHADLRKPNPESNVVAALLGGQAGLLNLQAGTLNL